MGGNPADYIANNPFDIHRDPEVYQLLQIHELGHALTFILGMKPGPEDGTVLEDCVYGAPGSKK